MQRPEITAALGPLHHVLRAGHAVLFLADRTQDVPGGEGLVVKPHVLDDFLHDPLGIRGIIDGKAPGVAEKLNVTAQDPAACGMEGHGPHVLPLRAKHGAKPLLQLVGSLVGKGNGKDAPGSNRMESRQPVGSAAYVL